MKTTENKYGNPIGKRWVLEVLNCPSLVNDIEKHLIINKEPFLYYQTEESINCEDFNGFVLMLPETSMDENFELYFHLDEPENIDFKIGKKHTKHTLEDDIYKGVKLTLVYS